MDFYYVVTELRVNDAGGHATLCSSYRDLAQAKKKFFDTAATIAISTTPLHCVYLIRSDGVILNTEWHDLRQPEPEPEPEIPEENEGGEE